TLSPYTTLFRSPPGGTARRGLGGPGQMGGQHRHRSARGASGACGDHRRAPRHRPQIRPRQGEQALGPEGHHAAPAPPPRRHPHRPERVLPRPLGPTGAVNRPTPRRLRGPPLAASARPPRPRPPIGGPMLTVDYPGGTASIDADPTDHIGAHYAQGRWYEQDLLDDARARVHGPGLAVDVGPHIGGPSLWFTLACGLDVIAL